MSSPNSAGQISIPVGEGSLDARADFITRSYNHLMGAIVAFVGVELLLFGSGAAATIASYLLPAHGCLCSGAFMIVGYLATKVASQSVSLPSQYAALGAYVLVEAIIFVPMLYIAEQTAPGVIQSAAIVTLLGFAGLTAVVFTTRKDFSFLSGLIRYGFILALVAIVAGVLFGFQLGTWFSVAMVGLAGAAILYETSNVLHHYPEDRYVAASLALFASVAVLFWYVLRIFMGSDD